MLGLVRAAIFDSNQNAMKIETVKVGEQNGGEGRKKDNSKLS